MISKTALAVFTKSQVSAFIGGIIDYGAMLFFTEILGIYYVYSILIGGVVGAIVNYSINRYWAFNSRAEPKSKQIPKFILVVAGSIFLKTAGTFGLTEWLNVDYRISRLITDALVALGFNFTLQKYWVFKE